MELKFTRASRKHRIGHASIRFAMATSEPIPTITNQGKDGWKYIGNDEQGRELEVIAVELPDGKLLVIHAMPTNFRRNQNA